MFLYGFVDEDDTEEIEGRIVMNVRLVDDAVRSGDGFHVRSCKKSTIRFSAQ